MNNEDGQLDIWPLSCLDLWMANGLLMAETPAISVGAKL